MKIYKITQNVQYLQSIGVPPQNINEILNYLLSLKGDDRKKAVRQVRKNPNITIEELKQPQGKEKHLKEQNIPQEVIDFSQSVSEKYSVWVSREIMKWLKSIEKWIEELNELKRQKVNEPNNPLAADQIQKKINEMYVKQDPITGIEFQHLAKNLENGDKDLFGFMGSRDEWRDTMDWVRHESPDIMQYSFEEALEASEKWHEELKQKEADESIKYKTNNVVHSFGDGWNIVQLSPGDCKAEGEQMGHCVADYADDIAKGRTQIYSLRDPGNEPHVTIEMEIPDSPHEKDNLFSNLDNPSELKFIDIEQIQGKEDKEPIEKYKNYIKQWFQTLKSQGYQFEPIEPEQEENVDVSNFTEFLDEENDYGVPVEIHSIGGDAENWLFCLKEAYMHGEDARGYYRESKPVEIIDNLMNYALRKGEIKEFNQAVLEFDEWANEQFIEYEIQLPVDSLPPYPDEEDFTTYPEEIENQTEFDTKDFEKTKQEKFDEEAYNEALKNHYRILEEIEEEFPPTKMSSYIYKEWNDMLKQNQKVAKQNNFMVKTAEKEIPDAEEIAAYIDALNLHLKHGKVKDPQIKKLVEKLPFPDTVRLAFSEQECRIVFESIAYAWKKITNQDLVKQVHVENAPKGLEGNYWMIKNGVLLQGPNHFTIIKRNLNLFATLLGISSFVLHEKLASPPNEIIKTVIDHGGMRMFINENKELYCQVRDETYSEWAREKIKKMDCKKRIVNVIDSSRPYKGWESGITVLL